MIHTSVRSPHSFTIIFQALPADHVPLARLLRLTPEDRTFPAPVKAGSWTWKTVIYGDRLEPVPVIKIHQNTIFDSAAVLFFVFLIGASGVGL